MNLKTPPRLIAPLLLMVVSQFSCQRQDYRLEVAPGQQGQTELRRVPYTPEEQAAHDREQQVRAALAQKPQALPDPDLATLESLWPNLSPADRAALLETAKQAAAKSK